MIEVEAEDISQNHQWGSDAYHRARKYQSIEIVAPNSRQDSNGRSSNTEEDDWLMYRMADSLMGAVDLHEQEDQTEQKGGNDERPSNA